MLLFAVTIRVAPCEFGLVLIMKNGLTQAQFNSLNSVYYVLDVMLNSGGLKDGQHRRHLCTHEVYFLCGNRQLNKMLSLAVHTTRESRKAPRPENKEL